MKNLSTGGWFPVGKLPQVRGGFGFTVSEQDLKGIDSALQQSQAVASNLKESINQHIVNQLASQAVNSDMLRGQIAQNVNNSLVDSASVLAQVQQPIHAAIISPMSTTLESTIPLGVVPPTANNLDNIPLCVQVLQSARQGNYDLAIAYYAENGGKHGLPLTSEQIAARQYLQNCLAGNQQLIDRLNASLDTVDIDAGKAGFAINTPVLAPGLSGSSLLPLTVVQQTAVPKPLTVGSSSSIIHPSNPFIDAATQGQSSTVSNQSVAVGGSGSGCNLQPGQVSLIGISTNPSCPSTGPIDPCAAINAVGWQTVADAVKASSNGQGFLGGYVTWPSGSFTFPLVAKLSVGPLSLNPLTAKDAIVFAWSGLPPGIGGQGYCDNPGSSQSNTQTQQTQQQQTTQQTTCCPPPTINVTCGTQQQTQQSPPKCTYNVYCSDDGILYFVRSDQPPKSSSDTKLGSGDPAELNLQSLIDQCQGTDKSKPDQFVPVQPGWIGVPEGFNGCATFGPLPGLVPESGQIDLATLIGLRNPDGSVYIPFPNAGTTDFVEKALNVLVAQFGTTVSSIFDVLDPIISQSPCGTGESIVYQSTNIALAFLDRWIGTGVDFLKIPNDYQRHYVCPQLIPEIGQATAAFLGGQIDEGTLECWVRANNGKYPEFKPVVDSQRSKLTGDQFAIALRRGLVTQAMYDQYIRECGYLRNFEPKLIYDLTAQIPPPSDIVRMMIRDAEDTVNIDWTQSDKIFGDKYTGQLEKWGEQQGIDKTYMRYLWRSHWSLPSPGQLYDMLHRLSRLPANDPAYVDQKTIRTTLLQQDIHPDWVDRFMAISYNPLTRIDSRRAYEIGVLDKAGLKEAYLNLGYNADNADTLVEFNDRNVRRTFLRRPEVKQLAAGELSIDEFEKTMRIFGASDYAIEDATKYAELLLSRNTRRACVNAIHKRYKTGDITASEATQKLTDQNVPQGMISKLVSGWQCERDSKGKVLTAAQIIGLYQDSLIDEVELVRRLQNVGYSEDDSITLARQQAYRKGVKIHKSEIQQMRQQAADAARLARQVASASRKKESAQRRVDNEALRARKVSEAREKRLLEAGYKYALNSGMEPADGALKVKALYNAVLAEMPVTRDEVIAAILLAAQNKTVTDDNKLYEAVTRGIQNVGYIPPDPPTQSDQTDVIEASGIG